MYEMIITSNGYDKLGYVYTKVHRFEFESEEQIDRILANLKTMAISGGQMHNA